MPEKRIRIDASTAGTSPAIEDEGLMEMAVVAASEWADSINRTDIRLIDKQDGFTLHKGTWKPYVDFYFDAPSAYERNLERLATNGFPAEVDIRPADDSDEFVSLLTELIDRRIRVIGE